MTNLADQMSTEDALSALAWQIELGADEAILDVPVNRYELEERPAKTPVAARASQSNPLQGQSAQSVQSTPVDTATALAAACADLDALKAALAGFEGCALKQGARNLVFADGVRGARLMIVGEAPGREEDKQGLPFVGPEGQFLDKMFNAIGLSRSADDRANGIYIINTLPWRPPQDRAPSSDELAMLLPFLRRHIELAKPDILVTMGNPSTKTLLGTSTGISKMRGRWAEVAGIPTLPMYHPTDLIRGPAKKRDAWADLLMLKARFLTQ